MQMEFQPQFDWLKRQELPERKINKMCNMGFM